MGFLPFVAQDWDKNGGMDFQGYCVYVCYYRLIDAYRHRGNKQRSAKRLPPYREIELDKALFAPKMHSEMEWLDARDHLIEKAKSCIDLTKKSGKVKHAILFESILPSIEGDDFILCNEISNRFNCTKSHISHIKKDFFKELLEIGAFEPFLRCA